MTYFLYICRKGPLIDMFLLIFLCSFVKLLLRLLESSFFCLSRLLDTDFLLCDPDCYGQSICSAPLLEPTSPCGCRGGRLPSFSPLRGFEHDTHLFHFIYQQESIMALFRFVAKHLVVLQLRMSLFTEFQSTAPLYLVDFLLRAVPVSTYKLSFCRVSQL